MSLTGQEISGADVVLKRSVAKVYPVSGSTYNANANRDITFRISSDDFADLSALTLFTQLKVHDPRLTLDDLHSSILERVVVQLNGTTIEDISNVNDLHKIMTYCHVPKGYYTNEMHASQGSYKYVPSMDKKDHDRSWGCSENDFNLRVAPEFTDTAGDRDGISSNMYLEFGNYIAINLGTLLGISRGYNGETRLLPLRFFTELQITITIARPHRALVAFCPQVKQTGKTSTPADPAKNEAVAYPRTELGNTMNYELSNPFLLYTAVQCQSGYYQQFQQLLMNDGFVSFMDSYYCVSKQIPGTISRHDIALTISRSDIRALYCVFRPSKFLSQEGIAFPKSNFYLGDCFKSATLAYGSEIIPACRIESTAEAHYHLQSTLNKHNSIISGSVLDYDEYTGVSRKKLRGYPYKAYPADGNIPANVELNNPCDFQPSCFVLAFPLAKVYDSSATVGVGIDTLGTSAHMVLSIDFSNRAGFVQYDEKFSVVDGKMVRNGGTPVGVSHHLAESMDGWEMLVCADTSRVLRFAGGAVTASV